MSVKCDPRHGEASGEYQGLSATIFNYLRDAIFDGTFASGERLRQGEIASWFGISRVPVREALKRLEVEGLAEFRPRRGYIVAALNSEDIEDIFSIRKFIEARAGYLAAKNRTLNDIRAVETILEEMDSFLKPTAESIQRFADLNRQFHQRLFEPCGRIQLLRTLDMLRDQVERYVRIDATAAGRLKEAQDEHYEMFEAFNAGDASRLRRLCAAHAEHTRQRLVQVLNAPLASDQSESQRSASELGKPVAALRQ